MSKEIDFSKAPEGATHYAEETKNLHPIWVKYKGGNAYYMRMDSDMWIKNPSEREFIAIPTSWSIYTNDKPLCDLSDEQAAKLFNAWRDGAKVELLADNGDWCNAAPDWSNDIVYRIKQKSERELFILGAEKIIDESGCFKDDRAIAISTACCLFDSGKFKLVEQPK